HQVRRAQRCGQVDDDADAAGARAARRGDAGALTVSSPRPSPDAARWAAPEHPAAPDLDTASVGLLCFGSGLRVDELTEVRGSLEEAFVAATGGAVDYRSAGTEPAAGGAIVRLGGHGEDPHRPDPRQGRKQGPGAGGARRLPRRPGDARRPAGLSASKQRIPAADLCGPATGNPFDPAAQRLPGGLAPPCMPSPLGLTLSGGFFSSAGLSDSAFCSASADAPASACFPDSDDSSEDVS